VLKWDVHLPTNQLTYTVPTKQRERRDAVQMNDVKDGAAEWD